MENKQQLVTEGPRKHPHFESADSPQAKRKCSQGKEAIRKDTEKLSKELKRALFGGNPPKPRHLVITRENGSFQKISPFLIAREIAKCAGGPVKEIKKNFNRLYIETFNDSQSDKLVLLKKKKIGDFSVHVQPHKSLNSSKGVVFCRDLLNCTEDEIVEEMSS